jgi:F-type H+-transporting ATPase subunit b
VIYPEANSSEPERIPTDYMTEIVQQVGALLVGAIPTAVLFIVLVLAYQFLVQNPLTETLKKRHALTAGAMEESRRAIAEAEARAQQYAESLRRARAEAYQLREQRLKQWNRERDAALEAARKSSGARVSQAKTDLEAETRAARQLVETSAPDLAGQVVRAVLPAAAIGGPR